MPKLGNIPYLPGPYLELADPTPTIDRPEVLAPIANALNVPIFNAIINQIAVIKALQTAQQQEVATIQQQLVPLDSGERELANSSLAAAVSELQTLEALIPGIDQVLVELAAVDPANFTGPPFDLFLPELTEIFTVLNDALFLWDGAFPLWPFGFPG